MFASDIFCPAIFIVRASSGQEIAASAAARLPAHSANRPNTDCSLAAWLIILPVVDLTSTNYYGDKCDRFVLQLPYIGIVTEIAKIKYITIYINVSLMTLGNGRQNRLHGTKN